MNQKNQHEWGFMANPTEKSKELHDTDGTLLTDGNSDLGYCPLCKQWTFFGGPLFKMTYARYIELYIDGFIEASEVLTNVEDAKRKLAVLKDVEKKENEKNKSSRKFLF